MFKFLQPLLEEDTGTSGTGTQEPAQAQTQEPSKTFTQEDVDKLIQDRIAREQQKWQKKVEEEKLEAEKLAKMKAEEKAKYEEEKRMKALEERENAIKVRELKATAIEILTEKNLPKDLIEILNYTDAETCNKSIEAVEKAFTQAVEKAVNERLKGDAPLKKAPQNSSSEQEQLLKIANDITLPLVQRIAAKNKLLELQEE